MRPDVGYLSCILLWEQESKVKFGNNEIEIVHEVTTKLKYYRKSTPWEKNAIWTAIANKINSLSSMLKEMEEVKIFPTRESELPGLDLF